MKNDARATAPANPARPAPGRTPAQPMASPLPNPDRRLHQMGNPLPSDAEGGVQSAAAVHSVRPPGKVSQPAAPIASRAAKRQPDSTSGLSVSGFHHTRLVHTYPSELVFRSISEDQLEILEEGTPSVLLDGLCGLCVSLCIGIFPNIVMPLLALIGSGGNEALSQRESILSLLLLAGLLGVAMTLPGIITRRRRVRQLISKLRCQKIA